PPASVCTGAPRAMVWSGRFRATVFIRIFFFFNDPATTEIYPLSLHDALPISLLGRVSGRTAGSFDIRRRNRTGVRSEEHTSELQSHVNLVCRLLLEKKSKTVRFAFLDENRVRQGLARRGIESPTPADAAALSRGSLGVALKWIEDGFFLNAGALTAIPHLLFPALFVD